MNFVSNEIKMLIKGLKLPSLPGVYLFKQGASIIYIGKASNIKSRVRSYFSNTQDWKAQAIVAEHSHIDHIITNSEIDASLLEAQLIQEHQPKFNVALKDGQPFLYLFFTSTKIPRLELVRNKNKKGSYFGPFLHKKQARSVFAYLIKTFRLFLCKKKIEQGCLNYHLGHCSGTCLPTFDLNDYAFRLNLAKQLLQGHYKQSLADIKKQIKLYSNQMDFEKAKNLFDYEQNLNHIFETLKSKFSAAKYAADIFVTTTPYQMIDNYSHVSIALQQLLNMVKAPETIDCFDVSHMQGSFIVGSCIRFTKGTPDKNKFRRFAIKTLQDQNDYAALQEIVTRRYKEGDLPDLILIDGGKGQRNAIKKIITTTEVASLAKREETLYGDHISCEGIKLELHSEAGKLLLALRDYAHHFAISYHRLKKRKQSIERRRQPSLQ